MGRRGQQTACSRESELIANQLLGSLRPNVRPNIPDPRLLTTVRAVPTIEGKPLSALMFWHSTGMGGAAATAQLPLANGGYLGFQLLADAAPVEPSSSPTAM